MAEPEIPIRPVQVTVCATCGHQLHAAFGGTWTHTASAGRQHHKVRPITVIR